MASASRRQAEASPGADPASISDPVLGAWRDDDDAVLPQTELARQQQQQHFSRTGEEGTLGGNRAARGCQGVSVVHSPRGPDDQPELHLLPATEDPRGARARRSKGTGRWTNPSPDATALQDELALREALRNLDRPTTRQRPAAPHHLLRDRGVPVLNAPLRPLPQTRKRQRAKHTATLKGHKQLSIQSRTSNPAAASSMLNVENLRRLAGPAVRAVNFFRPTDLFALASTHGPNRRLQGAAELVDASALEPFSTAKQLRLTKSDHALVKNAERSLMAIRQEVDATAARNEELLRRQRTRRALAGLQLGGQRKPQERSSLAAQDEVERQGSGNSRTQFKFGLYGPVKVWVDKVPPKPPGLGGVNQPGAELDGPSSQKAGKNSRITKLTLSSRATATMKLTPEERKRRAMHQILFNRLPPDAVDGAASQALKDDTVSESGHTSESGQDGADNALKHHASNGPPTSLFGEDKTYRHFFVRPPPVLTMMERKSCKPATQVLPEELPNPRRPRPSGKGAVCFCFRMTGISLAGSSLSAEDAFALYEVTFQALKWVRFLVVREENGLEIRSYRLLEPSDIDIYHTSLVSDKPPLGPRVRVAMCVWVNRKDVPRAAQCILNFTKAATFAECLTCRLPSLWRANGAAGPSEFPKMLAGDDAEGNVQRGESGHASGAFSREKFENDADDTPPDDYFRSDCTVMSPASSAALFDITARIEAGLEISDELIDRAKADLERRKAEFKASNDNFEQARRGAVDGFRGAKEKISDWREVLYEVLIQSEYGSDDAGLLPAAQGGAATQRLVTSEPSVHGRGGILSE